MDLQPAKTTTLVCLSPRLIIPRHVNGAIYMVTATMTLKGKDLLAVVGILLDFLHVMKVRARRSHEDDRRCGMGSL